MTIIRKGELARELNISARRMSQLVRDGLPTRRDGRLDRTTALRWVRDNLQAQVGSAGSKGAMRAAELLGEPTPNGNGHDDTDAPVNPAAERARRDRALAERYERENLVALGELLHRDDVDREVVGMVLVIRTALLGLPSVAAPRCAARPVVEAHAQLTKLIDRMLIDLSRGPGAAHVIDWGLIDEIVQEYERRTRPRKRRASPRQAEQEVVNAGL